MVLRVVLSGVFNVVFKFFLFKKVVLSFFKMFFKGGFKLIFNGGFNGF